MQGRIMSLQRLPNSQLLSWTIEHPLLTEIFVDIAVLVYGYVRGTIGADGDQIDVFIGRRPDLLDRVWIIDQGRESKKGNIKFDEHKVMLGYKSLRKALRDYQAAYGSRKFVGSVTEMSFDDFKSWLQNGNLTRPVDSTFGTFTAKFNATMTSGRLRSRGKKRQKREKIFYELQS
jgi:hypothetical protein